MSKSHPSHHVQDQDFVRSLELDLHHGIATPCPAVFVDSATALLLG
jgi:hypothetical protein